MSTSSTKESEVHQTTDPWAPQAAALQNAFTAAQNAYGKSSTAVAPTDFTAQMTPEQLATFKSMVSQGQNSSIPSADAATGSALTGAGTNALTGALSGLSGYNAANTNNTQSLVDAAKAYVAGQDIPSQVKAAMQTANETARDVTMPGIEQNAATSGNTNSTRAGIAQGLVQRGLAEQAGNLQNSLASTAFQNGLTLAQQQASNNNTNNLAALTAAGSLGNNSATTGLGANSQSLADQGALNSTGLAGGTGLQQANQTALDNALQKYQASVESPYQGLSQLMSVIGSNNWGSSTNGTKTETSTPSAWDTISGLMNTAGKASTGLFGGSGLISGVKSLFS